jgi:adenosine deaminase
MTATTRSAGAWAARVAGLPKAELHLHIEGTLEPELMMTLADRNGITLPYPDADAVRRAYVFDDLQSFLDVYYAGGAVLQTGDDFSELTEAYLARAAGQGVTHAEIFFDPQTHTDRGIPLPLVVEGITRGIATGLRRFGITSGLILCFLRHLGPDAAMATLEAALPYRHLLTAVGLDSSEVGYPPSDFAAVFARAAGAGLPGVAHAGEEGPPEYIWQALDRLHVRRIDHGVRCAEDPALMERLRLEQVPLTVCPLSNVRLGVFRDLARHNLAELLRAGLLVTVNSDDPAYFGGYVADNLSAAAAALDLTADEVVQLARNSFIASFLPPDEVIARIAAVDRYADGQGFSDGAVGRPTPP